MERTLPFQAARHRLALRRLRRLFRDRKGKITV